MTEKILSEKVKGMVEEFWENWGLQIKLLSDTEESIDKSKQNLLADLTSILKVCGEEVVREKDKEIIRLSDRINSLLNSVQYGNFY